MKRRSNKTAPENSPTLATMLHARSEEWRPFSLDRSNPGISSQKTGVSVAQNHVKSFLSSQLRDFEEDQAAQKAPPDTSQSPLRDRAGLEVENRRYPHPLERIAMELRPPYQTRDFTIPAGSRVLGPPYDKSWTVGGGMFLLDSAYKPAGILSTFSSGDDGYTAAGVGFYLSSPDALLAAITPMGMFKYSWFTIEDLPTARSRGGLGITVYLNNDPNPISSRQAILWSVNGVTHFQHAAGEGTISSASSPATGLGPVPIAPVFVTTGPNLRYLIWVWCWQAYRLPRNASFFATLGVEMPFVLVNAAPPPLIH